MLVVELRRGSVHGRLLWVWGRLAVLLLLLLLWLRLHPWVRLGERRGLRLGRRPHLGLRVAVRCGLASAGAYAKAWRAVVELVGAHRLLH